MRDFNDLQKTLKAEQEEIPGTPEPACTYLNDESLLERYEEIENGITGGKVKKRDCSKL